jgi:hypoxanthine phosphoribosyltransferase
VFESEKKMRQPTDMRISKLISATRIRQRNRELGRQITAVYGQRQLKVIAVLHGALVFAADLIREIDLPLSLDIVQVASYHGTQSTGTVRHLAGPDGNLRDTDVLIVDDILDTGLTLAHVHGHIAALQPASIATCVLLDKPARRRNDFQADYVGFTIDNLFVVGYGLDFNGRWRNLPYIGVIES